MFFFLLAHRSGSLYDILLESLQFARVENYICLMKDAVRGRELYLRDCEGHADHHPDPIYTSHESDNGLMAEQLLDDLDDFDNTVDSASSEETASLEDDACRVTSTGFKVDTLDDSDEGLEDPCHYVGYEQDVGEECEIGASQQPAKFLQEELPKPSPMQISTPGDGSWNMSRELLRSVSSDGSNKDSQGAGDSVFDSIQPADFVAAVSESKLHSTMVQTAQKQGNIMQQDNISGKLSENQSAALLENSNASEQTSAGNSSWEAWITSAHKNEPDGFDPAAGNSSWEVLMSPDTSTAKGSSEEGTQENMQKVVSGEQVISSSCPGDVSTVTCDSNPFFVPPSGEEKHSGKAEDECFQQANNSRIGPLDHCNSEGSKSSVDTCNLGKGKMTHPTKIPVMPDGQNLDIVSTLRNFFEKKQISQAKDTLLILESDDSTVSVQPVSSVTEQAQLCDEPAETYSNATPSDSSVLIQSSIKIDDVMINKITKCQKILSQFILDPHSQGDKAAFETCVVAVDNLVLSLLRNHKIFTTDEFGYEIQDAIDKQLESENEWCSLAANFIIKYLKEKALKLSNNIQQHEIVNKFLQFLVVHCEQTDFNWWQGKNTVIDCINALLCDVRNRLEKNCDNHTDDVCDQHVELISQSTVLHKQNQNGISDMDKQPGTICAKLPTEKATAQTDVPRQTSVKEVQQPASKSEESDMRRNNCTGADDEVSMNKQENAKKANKCEKTVDRAAEAVCEDSANDEECASTKAASCDGQQSSMDNILRVYEKRSKCLEIFSSYFFRTEEFLSCSSINDNCTFCAFERCVISIDDLLLTLLRNKELSKKEPQKPFVTWRSLSGCLIVRDMEKRVKQSCKIVHPRTPQHTNSDNCFVCVVNKVLDDLVYFSSLSPENLTKTEYIHAVLDKVRHSLSQSPCIECVHTAKASSRVQNAVRDRARTDMPPSSEDFQKALDYMDDIDEFSECQYNSTSSNASEYDSADDYLPKNIGDSLPNIRNRDSNAMSLQLRQQERDYALEVERNIESAIAAVTKRGEGKSYKPTIKVRWFFLCKNHNVNMPNVIHTSVHPTFVCNSLWILLRL